MLIKINPDKPQTNEVQKVVDILKNDGVIIYPTDTVYALGCSIYSHKGIERIARLKKLDPEKALFTFICTDIFPKYLTMYYLSQTCVQNHKTLNPRTLHIYIKCQ